MVYVVDAHTLIWHLTGDPRLGETARAALKQIDAGKDTGLIPTIVLAEILYASEHRRISITFDSVMQELRKRKSYKIAPFTQAILRTVSEIKSVPELHDRVIVATAIRQKAIVITRDLDITNCGIVKTIW